MKICTKSSVSANNRCENQLFIFSIKFQNRDLCPVSGELYKDMLEIFDNDLFHMGGDEVNLACWNSSSEITDYLKANGKDLSAQSFLDLWGEFQTRGNCSIINMNYSQCPNNASHA